MNPDDFRNIRILENSYQRIVEEARRAGIMEITPEFLDTVRNERTGEKGR
jgi:hypothetical protein